MNDIRSVGQAGRQNMAVDLQWACTDVQNCPAEDKIRQWAAAALQDQSAGSPAEVTIRVVDGPEMQSANAQWRGQDKTTNVLSFPADFPAETGLKYLGDMLVCAEVLAAESVQQGKQPEAHWAHIVVHGMLHLQGYDHIEDQEATEMERCEVEILQRLGYANPYLADSTDHGLCADQSAIKNITEVDKN